MRRTTKSLVMAATPALVLMSVAACSAATPAGPPAAASLAKKLGCQLSGSSGVTQWSYDTTQYVEATGGPCSDGTVSNFNAIVITFPSQGKENDWLHQNSMAESSNFPDGYFELAVGHLWIISSDSGQATGGIGYVVHVLGGKDTTF